MMKVLIRCLLFLAGALCVQAANATKFEIKDISGERWCLNANVPADYPIPMCSSYLPGTIRVIITPEAGELPVKCYGASGNSCLYSADLYVVAVYQGKFFIMGGYAWRPADISEIPATTAWPPWSGTGSLAYDVFTGEIDLNTGKPILPPDGFEVWVGISPAGSRIFSPGMVARIYPTSQ